MDYITGWLNTKDTIAIKDITKDSINYLVCNMLQKSESNFMVYIVKDNIDIELSKQEIEFYDKNIEVIKFPEWDTVPYDINSPQLNIQTERIKAMYQLLHFDEFYKGKKVLLLIAANALLQKVINKKDFKFIKLHVAQEISVNNIEAVLQDNCYENNGTAISLGNYSINNNVIDVVTFNNQCYRIILKNNKIDAIKSFDPETQIGFDNHSQILILPVREVIFNKNNVQNFKQNYRNYFGLPKEGDYLYQSISSNILPSGCENWLPLFYDNKLELIFDYITGNSIFAYNSNIRDNIADHVRQIKKYYELRLDESVHSGDQLAYNPIRSDLLYITNKRLDNILKNYTNIIFDANSLIKTDKEISLNITPTPNFFKESTEIFNDLKKYLN